MLGQMTTNRDSKTQTQRIPGIEVSGCPSTNPSTPAVAPSAEADLAAAGRQAVIEAGRRTAWA